MKKLLVTTLMGLMVLSACNEESTQENKSNVEIKTEQEVTEQIVEEDKTDEVNIEETEDVEETQSTEEVVMDIDQISVGVGLGDTLQAFESEYGENSGDSFMARFQDDYILPLFADDRAMNLKIQFEATNEPSRALEDAKIVAESFIPSDAQFVKEYSDDLPRVIMEYHSESIAKLYPEIEPVGTFIVIFSHGEGDTDDVFGITVGVGNNP